MSKSSFLVFLIIAGALTSGACKSDPPTSDCSCADAANDVLMRDAPNDVHAGDAASADPSTGVAECDAYIAYFKACTVMIAGWTPASAQAAADVMINEYKVAGATAGGKTMTAAHCVTELATYRGFASATCPDVK